MADLASGGRQCCWYGSTMAGNLKNENAFLGALYVEGGNSKIKESGMTRGRDVVNSATTAVRHLNEKDDMSFFRSPALGDEVNDGL